jgi:hypothetical protein
MRRKTLVIAVALAVVITAGCALQDGSRVSTKGEQEELAPTAIVVQQNFRTLGVDDAVVKIWVHCVPDTSQPYCTPYPSAWIAGVNNQQKIVFKLVPSHAFGSPGIQFDDNSYSPCDRDSATQYTCRPNNPSVDFHKYTIKVVDTTTNDPFVFTY